MARVSGEGSMKDVAIVLRIPNKDGYTNSKGQTSYLAEPKISRLNDPATGQPANPNLEPQWDTRLVQRPVIGKDGAPEHDKDGKLATRSNMFLTEKTMEKLGDFPSQPWTNSKGEQIGQLVSVRGSLTYDPDKSIKALNEYNTANGKKDKVNSLVLLQNDSLKPGPELPANAGAIMYATEQADRSAITLKQEMARSERAAAKEQQAEAKAASTADKTMDEPPF